MSLSNVQYDAIMRAYTARRARQRKELEKRLERIHRRIPALSSIEGEMVSLAAAQARAAVEGDKEGQASLRKDWLKLSREKEALLASHGFSPADCELSYDCPDCQDTGYVGSEKCRCLKQAVIQYLYGQSRLEEVLARENFNTFSYAYYEEQHLPAIRKAVMDAQLFIENFGREFQNLFFLGDTGTGKTFLSNCIARELLNRCFSVVYLTAFELFDLLASAHFNHDPEADVSRQSYPYIFACDLLILDDLGTELNNSFVSSQLFLCVNERILKRKATIISSNLSLETLRDAYSERTFSRITSYYTILKLPGNDIRLKKTLLGNT